MKSSTINISNGYKYVNTGQFVLNNNNKKTHNRDIKKKSVDLKIYKVEQHLPE